MYFNGEKVQQISQRQRLDLLNRMADGGVSNLSLLGGEPLMLGEDMFPMLDLARRRGIKVSLVSNGLLLTPETSARLIEHGLSNLVVSIESPNAAIHNQIRGKRTFERLLPKLESFLAQRNGASSPRFTVNTVLSRPNRPTFSEMIPFSRDLGADQWNALTLNYIGNAKNTLDSLALSQEEHTEVAIDVGMKLKRKAYDPGNMQINFTIVCPLVWEYVSKKYGVVLPQPEICCSASTSLLYLSPTGDLVLCDRVNSSGYIGAPLTSTTMHPDSLLTTSFNEIWASKQYQEMFEFVKRGETYAKFEPCNRCKYLSDRTCNPCPLQAYREEGVRYEECLKAEEFLGDISHYDTGPRTTWEASHIFEPAPRPAVPAEWLAEVRRRYPVPVQAIRSAAQADNSILLMHPQSLEQIKLNSVGSELWQAMDGSSTLDELAGKLTSLYRDVRSALGATADPDSIDRFAEQFVYPFVYVLHDHGFIVFDQSREPDAVPQRSCREGVAAIQPAPKTLVIDVPVM
jgi:radical SAM protein with 4Fe4S-binding SPASM domain